MARPTLRFEDLDLKAEKAKLVNFGSADVSIAGYCLADRDGNNHSAPFKQGTIIPAGGSVTVWAAPGKEKALKEDASNIFWRNAGNLKPRSKNVLNDDGDALKFVDADGNDVVFAASEEEVPKKPLSVKERFELAKKKREYARKMNEEEVVAEDRRAKMPANYENRKRKAEWEMEDEKKRKEAEEAGLDYERVKALSMPADEAGRRRNAKLRKKNADEGFSDFGTATLRQYQRLTKTLKPDKHLAQQSEQAWKDFGANSLDYGKHGEVARAGVDRMVQSLNETIEKRKNRSRRRAFHADADVDYINKRNMLFNKKAERFYGKYTQEIKDSLERGTAL